MLSEDAKIAKLMCETTAQVRLCRQRPPQLPLPKTADRPYATAILDLLADGINHNLRKRLDVPFYIQTFSVLSRLLGYLAKSRTKLSHHWSELWRSLLSFVRFLNQYADELNMLGASEVAQALVDVLTQALTSGEAFLPENKDYDDLFYKLVESGEALTKLRDSYSLAKPQDQHAVNTLIGVSTHYADLIESHRAKKEHLSPKEINRIIKQGYETLNIEPKEDAETVDAFREADHKVKLKQVARAAVADATVLVSSDRQRMQ